MFGRLAVVTLCTIAVCGCGSSPRPRPADVRTKLPASRQPVRRSTPRAHPRFGVGLRIVAFVDRSRVVRIPGRSPEPRTLVTLIRYPAIGRFTRVDTAGAPPARQAGPFPLVVFGHGYAVTPAPYARLLQAWARSGYVVAAPVFPLGNANAPGGPDEHDLVNQPRDMSVVITHLLHASAARTGFLAGLVDPRRIAVAGQSDGGETALAVAYDRYFRDRRVRAAVILSGAEIPGVGGFSFPSPSPPLLATQGTADTITPPSLTHAFFAIAPAPKYLLTLFGASHLAPYTTDQPQLGIVERVTIAFLDRYLRGITGALKRITADGYSPGISKVTAIRGA